ncbi:hypothetical protein LCGC14_2003760, partial [marine sediment metagenome]
MMVMDIFMSGTVTVLMQWLVY